MAKEDLYQISAAALHCARILLRNFEFMERPGGRVRATEKNLAIIVDVTTGIFRVQGAIRDLVTRNPWLDKYELSRNLDQLRDSLRALEIVNNRLPKWESHDGLTTVGHKESIERELTKAEIANVEMVSKALASARTVSEEQRVLQQAGIVARPR